MPVKPATDADILRMRAAILARRPAPPPAGDTLDVLEFTVARERYALEAAYVRDVHALRHLTPLPGTPPFLRGIVNVRGRIVPVFDLTRFFDMPAQGVADLHRVILVEGGGLELGLLADQVVSVRPILLDSLQPPPPTLTGIQRDYLRGVTAEHLIVLDAGRILGDARIVIDDEDAHNPR